MKRILKPAYRLKQYLSDIRLIRCDKRFEQSRQFYFRVYKNEFGRYKSWIEPRGNSQLPIDIIIPVVEKDLDTLPYVISSVRAHIKHPVKQVYIVAPAVQAIRQVAQQEQCVFVDELEVCPITKGEISFFINGTDRSGWIYQQLLKFNFDKVGACGHFLVVDADTIFIQDTCFEHSGKFFFDFSDEFHQPYYRAFELLTGIPHTSAVSFVSHYMLFSKLKLQELKHYLEGKTGSNLAQAIVNLKNHISDQSYFSEYETYANYCIYKKPASYYLRYWHNKSLDGVQLKQIEKLRAELGKQYRTISFHSYNK